MIYQSGEMLMYVNFLDICKDITKTALKILQAEYWSFEKYKISVQEKKLHRRFYKRQFWHS
jgi:hypothetical protein